MTKSRSELIQEVKNIYLSKDKELIPFVGAGTSIILDIPSWKELVKDYHKFVDCKLDFEELCLEYNEDFPKITDAIFDNTGQDLSKYVEFMQSVKPRATEYQALHIKLIKGFEKIITTNYDTAFESAIIDESLINQYTFLVFPDRLNPIDFQGKAIAYLHGFVKEGRFVFRLKEYEVAYNHDSQIKDFLKAVIKKNSLLFLGFSFNDRIFREKLKELILEAKKSYIKMSEVYENINPDEVFQKIYVIVNSQELTTDLNSNMLNDAGIDVQLLDDLISIDENGKIQFKEGTNFDKLKETLEVKLGAQYNSFLSQYQWVVNNKAKVNYFKELEIEVIPYSGNSIEVSNIIKDITQQSTSNFSIDLSSASTL